MECNKVDAKRRRYEKMTERLVRGIRILDKDVETF